MTIFFSEWLVVMFISYRQIFAQYRKIIVCLIFWICLQIENLVRILGVIEASPYSVGEFKIIRSCNNARYNQVEHFVRTLGAQQFFGLVGRCFAIILYQPIWFCNFLFTSSCNSVTSVNANTVMVESRHLKQGSSTISQKYFCLQSGDTARSPNAITGVRNSVGIFVFGGNTMNTFQPGSNQQLGSARKSPATNDSIPPEHSHQRRSITIDLLEEFHSLPEYFSQNSPPGLPIWAMGVSLEQSQTILNGLLALGQGDKFHLNHKDVMGCLYALSQQLENVDKAIEGGLGVNS